MIEPGAGGDVDFDGEIGRRINSQIDASLTPNLRLVFDIKTRVGFNRLVHLFIFERRGTEVTKFDIQFFQ